MATPRQLLARAPRLKRAAWTAAYFPVDSFDRVTRRRSPLTPPRGLRRFVGGGSFDAVGDEFLQHFVDLGGLTPEQQVLDIGCGIGRMAVPLTGYVTDGSYDGIDIVAPAIRWCKRHVSSRHPNFRFHHADVHNRFYNPTGSERPESHRFPFPDASFDFVFACSVFTHLLPGAKDRYLFETARVTRPKGTCFFTFYLVDDDAQTAAAMSERGFVATDDGYWTTNPDVPEEAVAYPEDETRVAMARAGLMVEAVHHGSWRGRPGPSGQDIVVCRRKTDSRC